MTRRFFKSLFLAALFLVSTLSAEIISSDAYEFSLDLPEGYQIEANQWNQNKSLSFNHPNIPVNLIVKVYDEGKSTDSAKTLKDALSKLQKRADIDSFEWNNTKSAIAELDFTLDKNYSGWAVCSPLKKEKAYIVLLCYCPTDEADICNQFMFSTLNSLCVNEEYYNTPGIMMSYAFPKEGTKNLELTIYGKNIKTHLDKSDEEASQFLVDLEFSVLALYIQHNMWKEAWQRYYRMIYRDSWDRLKFVMNDVLTLFEPYAKIINPEQPELFLAQMILTWVQSMEYKEHNKETIDSDFTSLPRAVCGEANDCDSRSLLVCLFMRAMGLESFILISPEYSHALAAVEINAPGQKYIPEGTEREFLMGETTVGVTWGTIAADQADRTKWFPAFLP